jgi:hypothetical protein
MAILMVCGRLMVTCPDCEEWDEIREQLEAERDYPDEVL